MRLTHILHTIIYTTNCTALKNKRKSNDAVHLVTGVHLFYIQSQKNAFTLRLVYAG